MEVILATKHYSHSVLSSVQNGHEAFTVHVNIYCLAMSEIVWVIIYDVFLLNFPKTNLNRDWI